MADAAVRLFRWVDRTLHVAVETLPNRVGGRLVYRRLCDDTWTPALYACTVFHKPLAGDRPLCERCMAMAFPEL